MGRRVKINPPKPKSTSTRAMEVGKALLSKQELFFLEFFFFRGDDVK